VLKDGKVYPRKGHEGIQGVGEVQLYSFFNLDARWGWMVNATFLPLNFQERDPLAIL
jgi:hypothetical protein